MVPGEQNPRGVSMFHSITPTNDKVRPEVLPLCPSPDFNFNMQALPSAHCVIRLLCRVLMPWFPT